MWQRGVLGDWSRGAALSEDLQLGQSVGATVILSCDFALSTVAVFFCSKLIARQASPEQAVGWPYGSLKVVFGGARAGKLLKGRPQQGGAEAGWRP